MFKIGEFSKLTQVSVRMLRYYDEAGLCKPAKIETDTGYRLYCANQIQHLNRIIYLRDAGFGVAEIKTVLNQTDLTSFMSSLHSKYAEIEQNLLFEQEKLKKIAYVKNQIEKEKRAHQYPILLKAIPAYSVLSIRRIIPNYYAEDTLWQALSFFAKTHQLDISDNTFSIYHDLEYKEENVDVELCVHVKKLGQSTEDFIYFQSKPIDNMAYIMVVGTFSNISTAYQCFASWLQKNGQYRMDGPNRQIVHRGPWNESDPDNYLIELQIPIKING